MAQYIEQSRRAEAEMAAMLERLRAEGHQVVGDEVIMTGETDDAA